MLCDLINCHTPIKQDNTENKDKVEKCWETLENEIHKLNLNHIKI